MSVISAGDDPGKLNVEDTAIIPAVLKEAA